MSATAQQPAGVPLPTPLESLSQAHTTSASGQLPPSPPETVNGDETKSPASPPPKPEFPLLPSANTLLRVLAIDKPTPDSHVPRDPRLIRLTGVHPFNTEAPLGDLYNEGFLTSPELFYVRNHGAVPEVLDAACLDWELSVEGLVANAHKMSLRQLLEEHENVTYPITLVCAGNRRKEQNIVRKSNGFSWGAAGVSTALFTGVMMRDIIERAKPLRNAKYVCMEGADKLPNGYYGTSVKLNWVLDPNRGIMLAHKMNGEMLRPDHGKPLRAVIPGQIGGRSVKWLRKLIVAAEPSDNWYHIYDNRVLPTMVDPDEAAKNPTWWTDERYAIYDLSPNSAIAFPAHDERISWASWKESYNVRGYAYSGGGRRITRCEVSLDKGKTWRLAHIDYAEDRYRASEGRELFGARLDMDWRETSFCWCFWELNVSTAELKNAGDIVVRAMDEAMCVQPRDMYWNVLGMMNNPWFRIAIHKEDGTLRFEHPTQPALMPGGWMERVKKAGGNLTNGKWGDKIEGVEPEQTATEDAQEIKMTNYCVDRVIEVDELKEHEGANNPWFVVNGEVYDGTPFLEEHPGGARSILSAAGLDSTDEFMTIHSETAKTMLPTYHIGTLSPTALTSLTTPDTTLTSSPQNPSPSFLSPHTWSKALLHSKTTVSPDTHIFRFTLAYSTQTLGLPTGQHVLLKLRDPVRRAAVVRAYTPVSWPDEPGFCDVLVKAYTTGLMASALDTLPLGHAVEFKGPLGNFQYRGAGVCAFKGTPRRVTAFNMVCGGSGITPIYQVVSAVLRNEADTTQCMVLYGNRGEDDILFREQLAAFEREHGERCRVVHTLSRAGPNWKGLRGRVGEELLRRYCGVEEGSMMLVCGPEAMERSVGRVLKGMGWRDEDVIFF